MRTSHALFALAAALVPPLALEPATPAHAQRCAFEVKPLPGDLGYRARGARCEGLYIELQSAPVSLRVISLTRGLRPGSSLDDVPALIVRAPPRDAGFRNTLQDSIRVLGQPVEAGLNWVLDGWATPDVPFEWRLQEVFRPRLSLSRIGLAGRAVRRDGSSDPVFVPLDVRAADGSARPDSIHFVFHLPEASVARVCIAGTTVCTGNLDPLNSGGYFDGYFAAGLPGRNAGTGELVSLVVQWRDATGSGDVKRDRLDIWRW